MLFDVLERNIRTFEFSEVELIEKAVLDSDTTVMFRPDGSVGGRIDREDRSTKNINVETVRLRSFLVEQVDCQKLDIEGAEFRFISDNCEYLNNVEHLFIEYHDHATQKQLLHEILDILLQAGFRYHIKEANPIFHPYLKEERGNLYDLQLNILCFRRNVDD